MIYKPYVDGFGALPDSQIKELLDGKFILGGNEKNINPSSLDLTLSDEIYRIQKIYQPREEEEIRDMLHSLGASPHDYKYPLERGVTYLARLNESAGLPNTVYAYCNPKSSTGRTDVLARVMVDGVWYYDAIPHLGHIGNMWIAIQPQSFPVLLAPGEALSQMRFFNRNTIFNETALELSFDTYNLLWDEHGNPITFADQFKRNEHDGMITLTAHIPNGFVGWISNDTTKPLDFSKRSHYKPEEFFSPIYRDDGELDLLPGRFYILYTKEFLRIPPHLSCEVVPVSERAGEFRTHYAGYVDAGWGWRNGDGAGRRIVLEMRGFSGIATLRDGQPVTRARLERMCSIPHTNYDSKPTSNYTTQHPIPVLSKHFDMETFCKILIAQSAA